MMKSLESRYPLILLILGAVFYLPFLGQAHLFDWDEINFAEAAREMLVLDEYLRVYINYEPFWEKPPLFLWMQALSMGMLGIGEYAARLPNAVCGILSLLILYRIGKTLYTPRFGFIWALSYFGCVLPFVYFKSGIIDPFFNLFIFTGLYYFVLGYWKKGASPDLSLPWSKWAYFALGGALIGLGILTKGPVAYLIAGLCMAVYWIKGRFRFYVNVPEFLLFSVAALLVTALWFGIETLRNGPWLVEEFVTYQIRLFSTGDAGHKGFPGYHFVVLLIGCFPASLFAIRAMRKFPSAAQPHQADFRSWMLILFWVVLILFSIVQTQILHYSSLCYFPLTFLAALTIDQCLAQRLSLPRWLLVGLGVIGGLFIVATLALPWLGQNIETIKPLFAADPFASANLEAEVTWHWWHSIPGWVLLSAMGGFFFLKKSQVSLKPFYLLWGGTALFVLLTLTLNIPNIEAYSQRAAVEFYEGKQQEDCYIVPVGFKSYAHLFYARKRPVTDERAFDTQWLLNGEVDKPVYVVCKIHKAENLEAWPQLDKLYEKNGFLFFQRK
ncbi:MAG: glycosyltransferase family 39 protein [Bacteroidota bacterium]